MKLVEKRQTDRITEKDILILYHGNCTDGFGAAWAAWNKFGDDAEYVGVRLDVPPADDFVGKEVYMLDFIYDEQYMKDFVSRNKKVVVIDHHLTSKEIVGMATEHIYDTSHSGAVLSWQYFHPGKKTPKLLEYVEDADIWKWVLPFSRELWMYIDLFDFNFNAWNGLCEDFENPVKIEEYAKLGRVLLMYKDKLVDRLVSAQAKLVDFEGFKTYAVNSLAFHSDIGMTLAKKLPPMAIIWSEEGDGRIHVSLRSDGTVDVSRIAAKFGGGGHKTSGGFFVESLNKLPWKNYET